MSATMSACAFDSFPPPGVAVSALIQEKTVKAMTAVPAVRAAPINLTDLRGEPVGLNSSPHANGRIKTGVHNAQARIVTTSSQSSIEQLVSPRDASVRIVTYHPAVNAKDTR
jgi:hypothetical protein